MFFLQSCKFFKLRNISIIINIVLKRHKFQLYFSHVIFIHFFKLDGSTMQTSKKNFKLRA